MVRGDTSAARAVLLALATMTTAAGCARERVFVDPPDLMRAPRDFADDRDFASGPPDLLNPFDFAHTCEPQADRFDGGTCPGFYLNTHRPITVGTFCDDVVLTTTRPELVCALERLTPQRIECRPCDGSCPRDKWECRFVVASTLKAEDLELMCVASRLLVEPERIDCWVWL